MRPFTTQIKSVIHLLTLRIKMSQMLLWLFLVGVSSEILGFNPVSGSVLPKTLIRSPLYPLKSLDNTKQYPEFAFSQCLDHLTVNGCNQTWNQVSTNY